MGARRKKAPGKKKKQHTRAKRPKALPKPKAPSRKKTPQRRAGAKRASVAIRKDRLRTYARGAAAELVDKHKSPWDPKVGSEKEYKRYLDFAEEQGFSEREARDFWVRSQAARHGVARRHAQEFRYGVVDGMHGKNKDEWLELNAHVENNTREFLEYLAIAESEGLTEREAKDLWYSPDAA